MNTQPCFVTVQINDRIVKGPIGEEQAMAIAKQIADGIFPHDTPVPAYSGGNQSNPKQQSGKDANGISPKQLMNLQKNPKWEQNEICERYQVNSLEELTKQQASAAIKASMDRKKSEKEQMH